MNNHEILQDFLPLIPLAIAYTEVHFRFKLPFSRYYTSEPEILVDAPHRIIPNGAIPILLLVKDSHLYPVIIHQIEINIFKCGNIVCSRTITIGEKIHSIWWWKMFNIQLKNISGAVKINVQIKYEIRHQIKVCVNHNYSTLAEMPLRTYLSDVDFPGSTDMIWGDMHNHTNLTEDMVEFGAPLKPTLTMSKALGLDFYCCTDHSYDLDNKIGSWIEKDSLLMKWNSSREEIRKLNTRNKEQIIPSEEVSVSNNKGRNVHALLLNNDSFVPGSGDGAENIFPYKSEFSIKTISRVMNSEAVLIAAHPLTPVPFFQWLFVKRGKWNYEDLVQPCVTGLQILNGELDTGFYDGLRIWVKLLLDGFIKYIYAGNDAHGNFNIFRQIKIPMINIYEKDAQIFGRCRTGVITCSNHPDNLITGIRLGHCIISNGPFINMTIENNRETAIIGDTITGDNFHLNVDCLSTAEFGEIEKIKIYKGSIGSKSEEIFYRSTKEQEFGYGFSKSFKLDISVDCYFRGEVSSAREGDGSFIALTNPIWIK